MSSVVVFARPGAVPPLAAWFHKDLELLIPTPEAGSDPCEGTTVVADVRVSPTLSPLAMLDRVATAFLLLRLFLPGAVLDMQHTGGSCFTAEMGEYWGDFYCWYC